MKKPILGARRPGSWAFVALLTVAWAGSAPSANAGALAGLEARVVSVEKLVSVEQYPVFDAAGNRLADASWRVISAASGNPFENYLAAAPNGRLLNWGGTYLHFSDDLGETWQYVRPIEPLLSGEGAVVVAPNGDIVGVTWDPYSGDHLLAFKHDAAGWRYAEVVLHTPFYDRPWIAVVPGPFTFAGQSYPYVSVLRGGWPSKEIWYVSLDGLNYVLPSSKLMGSLVSEAELGWLSLPQAASADWIQPHTEANLTPLNGGGGLAGQLDGFIDCPWKTLREDLRWRCFSLPGGQLGHGRLLTDAKGYLHLVDVTGNQIAYDFSADGGMTWTRTTTILPVGHEVEDWDFKTNGALATTAVAIHAHKGGADQDLLYRYSVSSGGPSLDRRYHLGLGDYDFAGGLNAANADRFDFASVAILPAGKIAISYGDSEHIEAALAIEQ